MAAVIVIAVVVLAVSWGPFIWATVKLMKSE